MFQRLAVLDACILNDTDFLAQYIAEHHEYDDFAVFDCNGYGPLHSAVVNNSFDCVKILLGTELVDVLAETMEEQNCLDLALHRNVSCDILKLLLESDDDFELMEHSLDSLRMVFSEELSDKQRTIVETIHQHRFLLDTYEIVDSIMRNCDPRKFEYFFVENIQWVASFGFGITKTKVIHDACLKMFWNLRGSSDEEQSKWLEILSKVFLYIFEAYSAEFWKHVVKTLTDMLSNGLNVFIDWCIKTWYLADSNDHRGLVEKLIKSYGVHCFDFIAGLHSSVYSLRITYYGARLHKNVVQFLFSKASKNEMNFIGEIVNILRPKLDAVQFSRAFYDYIKHIGMDQSGNANNEKMTEIIENVDKLKIFDKIQEVVAYSIHNKYASILWIPVMAFSTQITADEYFHRIQSDLQCWIYNMCESKLYQEQLLNLEKDEMLAQFCTKRRIASLLNLSRAKIRKVNIEIDWREPVP